MARVLEIGLWWGLTVLLWLATTSPVTVAEAVVAAVCAVGCATAARAARQAVDARWRIRVRWLRWATRLPLEVAGDTLRLARLWWARPGARGTVRPTELETDADPALAVTHRALAAVTVSAAPGSVVVDVECTSDGSALCLHTFGPHRSGLEEVVRR